MHQVIRSVFPSLHGTACASLEPACAYSGRLGPTVGPIVRSRATSTIPGVRGNRSPGARSTASTSIRKRFDLFAPKRRGNHSTNPRGRSTCRKPHSAPHAPEPTVTVRQTSTRDARKRLLRPFLPPKSSESAAPAHVGRERPGPRVYGAVNGVSRLRCPLWAQL